MCTSHCVLPCTRLLIIDSVISSSENTCFLCLSISEGYRLRLVLWRLVYIMTIDTPIACSATAWREPRDCQLQATRPTRASRSSRSTSRSINSRCGIPLPSFGSSAGVQGPKVMMMSAMMLAAGRMRRTLAEGPLHGPRGTVFSAAAAQRHQHGQQTSPRRVAGSNLSLFCPVKLAI